MKRRLNHNDTTSNSEPPNKRPKIEPVNQIALFTVQMDPVIPVQWNSIPMDHIPMWISGNSTFTKMCYYLDDANSHLSFLRNIKTFSPSEFLSKLQYPVIRFCNIPSDILLSLRTLHWPLYDIKYSHELCLKYEIKDLHKIGQWLSEHINYFQNNCQKIIGKKPSDQCDGSLAHLFIIKEYIRIQNDKWIQIIEEIKNEPHEYILPIDIIQYTIFEYIPEVYNNKQINFLNCNDIISQIQWFEYMFYFIQFTSKQWQEFCYKYILQNGQFDAIIVNIMQKNKKLALRKFKYPLLTELCIRLYPHNFSSVNISSYIRYAIEVNASNLLETCLTLLDPIKSTGFWGKLLFDVAEHIEDKQLYLFQKICLKMQQHCDGNKKIIEGNFEKFNVKFCDALADTVYDEVTIKCITVMSDLLKYDVHTVIPYCASTRNVELMKFLLFNKCIDWNLCQENYSKEMNKLLL